MKIKIMSAAQWLILGGTMTVSVNGVPTGYLGKGQTLEIDLKPDCHIIELTAAMRKKILKFSSSRDATITVRWNRISGKIETLCSGSDFKLLE